MMWQVGREGSLAIVTLDRPPENRILFSALAELDSILQSLAQDSSISLLVFMSACSGHFSAGADLSDIQSLMRGEATSAPYELWLPTLGRLESMPQPVVAAIDGRAANGGCELALACTLRVGSEAAQFAQTEIGRGAIPGGGGTQRLSRLIGSSRAAHMMFTGRTVAAKEALAMGLLNEIIDGADFRSAVLAWAAPIAARPRNALIAAMRAVAAAGALPLAEGLALEQRLFLEVIRNVGE